MRRPTSSHRRATQQAARAADEIGLARRTRALSQRAVARRAGVSWSTVDRIERGDPSVGLDTLCAVGEAAGVDIVIRAYPSPAPSLRDTGQLEIAEIMRSQAHAIWHAATEVTAGARGEAIDLVFFGPNEILDTEIERMATDFEGQYRRANQKRETLSDQHRRPVRLIMAIEDTLRNRTAVEPHLPFVTSVLPAGSREILAALRNGHALGRDGLLWVRRRRSRRTGRRD